MLKLTDSGIGSPGQETSFFGPLTKAAVIRFQEKYAESILSPWGFASGTGFVGRTTKQKLNSILNELSPNNLRTVPSNILTISRFDRDLKLGTTGQIN